MKTNLMAVLATVSMTSAASAQSQSIQIDWNDKDTLSGNIVQMCDDTYIENVKFTVPGKAGEDFYVEMRTDITSGKILLGCQVSAKMESRSTTYTVDGSDGGCTIEIIKTRSGREKHQSAIYEIHDAC